MPATNPPRHGLGQPPITHLLRATRPLLVTHCPSSNHLIGDRVNTETSYHHQRVGLSSPLVKPQPLTQSLLPGPPLGAAFHWLGPNTPQRLMWAGPQLMTSLGPPIMSFAGLVLGQAHLESHTIANTICGGGRGSASAQELDKQPSLLHLPLTHWGAPRGFEDSPMHNAQFAPNFLCT